MARREVDRPPSALSFVAPASWWLPALLAGAVIGGLITALSGPAWSIALTAVGGALLAETYWRRTRPPSADSRWSPVARRLFRRRPPSGGVGP